ncbi:MAG: DUF763 domain-containing protein [Candidatus Micrarchaeota archaeon]
MIDIPEEPRIPLYNYLLDLVESRDKKEASVYITNCGWLVEELWNDIMPKNRQGKKKLRALGLLAKLIHGTELDWKDPVKYSFAHGGKDGIPYPVDRSTYQNSISFLQDVLAETKSGEKTKALSRLAHLC